MVDERAIGQQAYQSHNSEESLIEGHYEYTNIWNMNPSYSKYHPAIFPDELAERIIKYYSFVGDIVLDPFAGIGTVGRVCSKLNRRFILIEKQKNYFEHMRRELSQKNLFYRIDLEIIR